MNTRFLLWLTVGLVAVAGCKKQDAAGPGSAGSGGETNPAALPPAPAYVSSKAENRPVDNAVGEVNPFLTQQLQIFIQQKQRMPQSFAELATFRLDSVPIPPEGKKWVIDSATRQVKAIAK